MFIYHKKNLNIMSNITDSFKKYVSEEGNESKEHKSLNVENHKMSDEVSLDYKDTNPDKVDSNVVLSPKNDEPEPLRVEKHVPITPIKSYTREVPGAPKKVRVKTE